VNLLLARPGEVARHFLGGAGTVVVSQAAEDAQMLLVLPAHAAAVRVLAVFNQAPQLVLPGDSLGQEAVAGHRGQSVVEGVVGLEQLDVAQRAVALGADEVLLGH